MKSSFIRSDKQTGIYVTAGFPLRDSLPDQLLFLQRYGADFIEIGMPFSDPLADGPVIQQTSATALSNGMHPDLLFEQLSSVREQITIPIVLMGYVNPVLQYGIDRFLQRCEQLNVSGVILPDLPEEIFVSRYKSLFDRFHVPLIFLVTPKTSDERIVRMAQYSRNAFLYLIGQHRVTGTGYAIDSVMQERYKSIRRLCGKTPLFLGFGIDSAEKRVAGFLHCDGVIIGSAYLQALSEGKSREFIRQLGFTAKKDDPK